MFNSASPSRGTRSGYAAAALLGLALSPALGLGQELLTIHGTALESYQASATRVQDALPSLLLRGAYVDGSVAAGSSLWPVGANPAPDAWNRHGMLGDVRLAPGTYDRTYVDLALPSIGVPWVIGRTFLSNASTAREGPQGVNWFQSSQPEIFFHDHATNSLDMVYLVYGADRYLEFQRKDGSATTFVGVNGSAGIISYVSGSPDVWEYFDARGTRTTFFGGNTASNAADWQFWKIEDPVGNVAYVGDATTASTAVSGGYDASGRILYAYDMADRRYTYTYSGSAIGAVKRLTQVKAETKSSGTWASPSGVVEVGKVDYDYYTTKTTVGGVDIGDEGDLKLVTVTTPLTDSGVSLVTRQYFMYYFDTFSASDNRRGSPHQLPGRRQ
ncbi:MAG: hypothetical protein AB7Q91_15570 [Phycisphaerales bacterium]